MANMETIHVSLLLVNWHTKFCDSYFCCYVFPCNTFPCTHHKLCGHEKTQYPKHIFFPKVFKINGGIGLQNLHNSMDLLSLMADSKPPFKNHKFIIPSTHNTKHGWKLSPTYISKKNPAYGKLSQACGEMKSPIGGSKHMRNMPHSPHLPCREGLQGSLWL